MEIMGMTTGYNKFSPQMMPHRIDKNMALLSGKKVNVGSWERILSAAIGGFLLYRAYRSRNLTSALTGLTGLGVMNRGVSGFCPMYNKYGISSTR